jgi:hypothetical protein
LQEECDLADVSWLASEVQQVRGKEMTDDTEQHLSKLVFEIALNDRWYLD